MLKRYFSIYRLCLINFGILICVSVLFYNSKQNKLLNVLYINQSSHETEKSLFKSRLNHRLFFLGQRFSHINISKLLHIQSSSTKTLTYSCRKYCGGWGDRLRGITSTYILAVLLHRRFTLDMQYPYDLTHFLLPNLVNWTPNHRVDSRKKPLELDPMHEEYASELYANISSRNLSEIWSKHDHVLLTTNNDYITPALQNPFFSSIKTQINFRKSESTQQFLFAFIFELLFKPTSIVIDKVDQLLMKSSLNTNQYMICMHIRIGQNPTVPKDEKLPFRQSIVRDMIEFINRNLSHSSSSSIFITSDAHQIQEDIYKYYGAHRVLSISGPILHIDRFNSRTESNETLHHGFLKVISDFYFLGECDTLLRSRSGFSEWAGRRRLNEYSNLYLYCRGMHQMTSSKWRRPHVTC